METTPRLLNYEEAADYLKLTVRTVKRLVAERAITVVRIRGHQVRFTVEDLDRYIERSKERAIV